MKQENYYGIKFNDDIPLIDKINEFNKSVEIKFIGKAFIVNRKDDKVEKIEIENYYKFEKEGLYEIEFINNKQETYNLKLQIENNYIFLIILLLLFLIILSLLFMPFKGNKSLYNRIYDFINISVVKVDIEDPHRYVFDVEFDNLISSDISLPSTMNAKTVSKNKIAPGVNGEFAIVVSTENSTVDMQYSIKFEDVSNEKPNNMRFKIKGSTEEFKTLQELESKLKGVALKDTEKEIIIQWRWPYEIDDTQDIVDTNDGKELRNYKFRIKVFEEEAIK